jgi:predicted Zn-dependent protease
MANGVTDFSPAMQRCFRGWLRARYHDDVAALREAWRDTGPAANALSRRWEQKADRFALELTGDRAAYEQTFRRLAASNLADLDPPKLVYLLLFTHPTPPQRLAAAIAE